MAAPSNFQDITFMESLERRYRAASGLADRSRYKIFYCPVHRAPILALGINPGGDPGQLLANGVDYNDGVRRGSASATFHENDEHDVLDCDWRENNLLKVLLPLCGDSREELRRSVVKTNLAFRRSKGARAIDIEHAKSEAEPFLREIIARVCPALVLLAGAGMQDFVARYASGARTLVEPERDPRVRQTVFAATSALLGCTGQPATIVQVAHASQFSWTYEQYGVVGRIRQLMPELAMRNG